MSTPSTPHLIDGKQIAAGLRANVAQAVTTLQQQHGLKPGLAVVLVGNDPASEVYVRNKGVQTVEVGMASFEHRLPADTSEADLLALVRQLNDDPAVHGILVQFPVPAQIRQQAVIDTISPEKDVDGLHPLNAGRLASGMDSLVPCTPYGTLLLARHAAQALGWDGLSGRHAVIVGRSNLVGKPAAQLLLGENCTVTIAHSRSADLPALCREADVLVAAVGRAHLVKADWVRPGAIVLDVGMNRIDNPETGRTKLVGDVDFAGVSAVAGAITPVPGGVGPMTIACLLRNTVVAACRLNGVALPEGI